MGVAALCDQADTFRNDPLTLAELREMCGEPVYIVEGTYSYYALISGVLDRVVWLISRWDEREVLTDDYGKTWLAYRRKPEEDKHEAD